MRKLSELIFELQRLGMEHGDIDVFVQPLQMEERRGIVFDMTAEPRPFTDERVLVIETN